MNNSDDRLELIGESVNWIEQRIEQLKIDLAGKSPKDIRSNKTIQKQGDNLIGKLHSERRMLDDLIKEIGH